MDSESIALAATDGTTPDVGQKRETVGSRRDFLALLQLSLWIDGAEQRGVARYPCKAPTFLELPHRHQAEAPGTPFYFGADFKCLRCQQ